MKTRSLPAEKLAFALSFLALFLIASACSTPNRPAAATLTAAPSTLPTPAVSATAHIHVVKKGEDFGGIAYQAGITLKALMEANPKVNPNLMSVGTQLVIPAAGTPPTAVSPQAALPTAVPIQLSQPVCYPTLDGGLDCFTLVSNPLTLFVESVSVTFHLANADTGETFSQAATTPLNLVPPGWAQPVHALFRPPVPAHPQVSVQLQNSLPYTASDQRYINVRLENRKDSIAADGLSAVMEGDLILDGDAAEKASAAWVAAAAFDARNQGVGLRRWQSSTGLVGGQPVHFLLHVYSAGPVIDHLTLLAEARR